MLATTARAHDQAKLVMSPEAAIHELGPRVSGGETTAIVFGRERIGLMNDEVAMADGIVTLPINPAFASLNLAQAVAVVSYEWLKVTSGNKLPHTTPQKSPNAPKQQMAAFLENLERELDRVEFFRPPEKRDTMLVNLRNIFARMQASQQDIQTLSGVLMALVDGRKGPARGGILDGDEAERLRKLVAERGRIHVSSERAPARGLAKLLRRNPTDEERVLWEALTRHRRFAGLGFKRQVPIGPFVADLVSFPLRVVIDLVPAAEEGEAAEARIEKRAWLGARNYKIVEVAAADVATDVGAVLERLADKVSL